MTDSIVSDAAVEAWLRSRQGPHYPDLDRHIGVCRQFPIWEETRIHLAAAAPHIAAKALRDAVDHIAFDVIGTHDGPWIADALDQERISFAKVRQSLSDRAAALDGDQ